MAEIDIRENYLLNTDRKTLSLLISDKSSKKNIIWATNNYTYLGDGYGPTDEITIESITGKNGFVIRPRIAKTKKEKAKRVRDKAEVFTPAWMCNRQNNLIDNAWFNSEDVFNKEAVVGWETNTISVPFPTKDGKTWQDYVQDVRLEITCGEAPYLTSRYDMITGLKIDVPNRIGLLDRKLRVVTENTDSEEAWLEWSKIAIQSIYGYEWQGDNLLLARENILYTYIEHHEYRFNKKPPLKNIRSIAHIVSWNIWQMDGSKGVIPYSCQSNVLNQNDSNKTEETTPCIGCVKNDLKKHNGIYCKIKNWKTGGVIRFIRSIK